MKTIGLVGGVTWFSTLDYYRIINERANKILGGDETPNIVLYSVNYGEIKKLTFENNWKKIAEIIGEAAKKIEQAGARCLLIGSNTMHNIADEVQAAISIPLIHIADATAEAIKAKGLNTVALLGTKFTMQLPFYSEKLRAHGIKTLIPQPEDMQFINTSIYEELGRGIFSAQTKEKFQDIIRNLSADGAEGVILGCTEIPLLIKQEDSPVQVFDTTRIHAGAAVTFSPG